MMQGVYTRETYVSDFALGIRNTYSFEEYFMLWPQCFILWPQKTIKTVLLDYLFFFQLSYFFNYTLNLPSCRSDIIKVLYLKICDSQIFVFQPRNSDQTTARSIYQRKLKWSYEALANFSFENFVNRGIILKIPILQSDFEEPFNFKVEKLEF